MEDPPNFCWPNSNFLPHAILEAFLPCEADLSFLNVPLAANYPQHAVFKAFWIKACVFINKISFPAEEWSSRHSVSSNRHGTSGFPWPLISFDSYIVPLRAAFPFLSWQGTSKDTKVPAGRLLQLYPEQPHFTHLHSWRGGTSQMQSPWLCLDSGLVWGHQEQLCSQCDGGKVERGFAGFKYKKYYPSE